MMARLKALVWKIPGARPVLRRVYVPIRRTVSRLNCYMYDMGNDRRNSYWFPPSSAYGKLSHELIFQHHKLEKGLSLPPGGRKFFGAQACNEVLEILKRWKRAGHPVQAPVYQSSLAVLKAYRLHLNQLSSDNAQAKKLSASIGPFLNDLVFEDSYKTPVPLAPSPDGSFPVLQDLALARRSVRNFSEKAVERDAVIAAVKLAQLSPSACNRQPWKLHLFENNEQIRDLLALQNGNSGFGQTIPLLAAVTVDMESGFDPSERVGPVLDGGLFLMAFLLALQSQGISSCCLNWAVVPAQDRKGHLVSQIPKNERILTLLAIGYAAEDCIVPLSARRPLDDALLWH